MLYDIAYIQVFFCFLEYVGDLLGNLLHTHLRKKLFPGVAVAVLYIRLFSCMVVRLITISHMGLQKNTQYLRQNTLKTVGL